eukprot:m.246957 g.246957  ORF g.246957 m.246957 type:complete len:215 (+) comp22590_c0_seq3:1913-2557(+)
MADRWTIANRLKLQIQERLGQLARSQAPENDELQVYQLLEELDQQVEELGFQVLKEPLHMRGTTKTRVTQLGLDAKDLRKSLSTHVEKRKRKERQESERAELLTKSYSANSNDTALMIDASLDHHDRLSSSNRAMDDMLGTAHSVLENLRGQGSVLKRTQRRVLDIANTLGLSNTVMRFIEQRSSQDKFILWAGMVTTLGIMGLLYYYFVMGRA